MPVNPGPVLPSDVTAPALSQGPLEQPIIWQLLLLGAGAAACLLWRQRPRRTPVGNRLVIVGTLAALAGAFWVNDYVGYLRTPNDLAELMQRGTGAMVGTGRGLAAITAPDDVVAGARTRAGAADTGELRLVKVALPDPARGVPTGVADVLLPPGYDDPANRGRSYPVVYLIHGYPAGSSDDWFTAGNALATMRSLLAEHVTGPMIVVAPDMTAEQPATDWECLNVPGGPRLEDYLVDSVLPRIDHDFRTVADRAHRSLGGMSGGGFCTLNIGLRHLGLFSSLLITLPYDTLGSADGLLAGHPNLLRANTPRQYLPTMPFPRPISVIVDTGRGSAGDLATTGWIANTLASHGQQVAVRLEPGMSHTWRTARAALPYLLTFADEHFPAGAAAGMPNS